MSAGPKPLALPRQQSPIVMLDADEDPNAPGWIDIKLETRRGTPHCRVRRLRSEGVVTKLHRAALFTARPCTFRWHFTADESWVVLAGRATVIFDTGEVLELGPGKVASVTAGQSSTWVVHETIRKFLVVSSA